MTVSEYTDTEDRRGRKEKVKQKENLPIDKENATDLREIIDISSLRVLEREFSETLRKNIDKLRIHSNYPEWVKEPWARVSPPKKFISKWIEKWSEVLLIYSKIKGKFLFTLGEIIGEWPFTSHDNSLKVDDLRKIVDCLVKKGLARWMDEAKNTFVIYWISWDILEVMILETLKHAGLLYLRLDVLKEILNGMPTEDILKIFNRMIRKGLADWIIKNRAIKMKNLLIFQSERNK